MHIEAIGFSATAAATTGTAATALTGDSLTIKNARQGSDVFIIGHWGDNQAAGYHQISWPTGHDTTRGYRVRLAASEPRNLVPAGLRHRVQPQDVVSAVIAGAATGGDVDTGVLLLWYADLPGTQAKLLTFAEVKERVEKLTTIDCSITTTAGPGWTGSEAINAESDLLMNNRDYALLGLVASVECAAVGVKAPDWGNVRVAVPGHDLDAGMTASFFLRLSEASGLPTVPVFNAGNRANVLIDACQDENAAAVTVSLCLALLRQDGGA